MQIIHTEDFDRNLDKLPKQMHRLLKIQEERFKSNWRDPRLHIKKVRSLENAFSLRITRLYRAFFYFQNTDTAIFFDIDHRKDIYR
jgi:mRNA-degrading endonuclease RelE of RelBE toxin-antitoxin system